MNHHKKIQLDILEDDIDHNGLSDLLSTIAEICKGKSQETNGDKDHVRKWRAAQQTINGIDHYIKELVG